MEATTRVCATCQKPATKQCSRCHKTSYCTQACQKLHWKLHKSTCIPSGTSSSSSSFSSTTSGANLLDELINATSPQPLKNLPPHQVYKRLIDAYRLRIEDEYTYQGETSGLYNMEDPHPHFKKFLNKAEKRNVLPSWWCKEKRAECERLGMGIAVPSSSDSGAPSGEGNKEGVTDAEWCKLSFAVEKSDIQEHYGDSMMPMKLRALAERVYGSSVMEF